MQRELYVNKGGNTGRALVLLDRALFRIKKGRGL